MNAENESLASEPSGLQSPPSHKSTGPRSEMGKQISSRNATKYGILSKALLLKGESKVEYRTLLTRLRDDIKPEGAREELLMEKLASCEWRLRRLLLAERGEIEEAKESLEWDEPSREHEEAQKSIEPFAAMESGQIQKIYNPVVLEGCIERLSELRAAYLMAWHSIGYSATRLTSIVNSTVC